MDTNLREPAWLLLLTIEDDIDLCDKIDKAIEANRTTERNKGKSLTDKARNI
jgi:hypothetical protein